MKLKQTLNLNLSRIKSRIIELRFPASKLEGLIPKYLDKLLYLSYNRVKRLDARARIAYNFFSFVWKMDKHHGPIFTCKWLKANSVVLQKYSGGERINSLRYIEPNLPLPRLINGLPCIINKGDRQLIRKNKGDAPTYRFWLSLFNIYRIWSIKGKLKLETITAPFSGDEIFLTSMLNDLNSNNLVSKVLHTYSIDRNIRPRSLVSSSSSSPSSSISKEGILMDIFLLFKQDMIVKGKDFIIKFINYPEREIIGKNIYNYLNHLY